MLSRRLPSAHPGRALDALASTRGVAALEFAIAVPVLALLVVGVFDLAKAVILWQQVYNAAHTIPVSASTLSVQPDKTTSLTPALAGQAMSEIYGEIPWIRDGIEHGVRSVTLSSVTFIPNNGCVPSITVTCTYTAAVTWSVTYAGGTQGKQHDAFTPVLRPCTPLPAQVTPTSPIVPPQTPLTVIGTALITQPDPILVADVHYQYSPFFLKFVTGPLDFYATGYWSARTVDPNQSPEFQYTRYIPDAGGASPACEKPDGTGPWP